MSEVTDTYLARLRREFDESFARPPPERGQAPEPILEVELGGARAVLKADALSGIQHGRRIVPVRGGLPELLGIGGLHGEIVPVYDLAQLMGTGRGSRQWSWWALPRGDVPIAFAFERLWGYAAVPPEAFTVQQGEGRGAAASELLRREGRLLPVVDLERLARAVIERVGPGAPAPVEGP